MSRLGLVAFARMPRIGSIGRRLFCLGGCAVAAATLASPALAAVRSATIADPAGDSPTADVVDASARYWPEYAAIEVRARFAAAPTAGTSWTLGQESGASCSQAAVDIVWAPGNQRLDWFRLSTSDAGSAAVSVTDGGLAVSAFIHDRRLYKADFTCMTAGTPANPVVAPISDATEVAELMPEHGPRGTPPKRSLRRRIIADMRRGTGGEKFKVLSVRVNKGATWTRTSYHSRSAGDGTGVGHLTSKGWRFYSLSSDPNSGCAIGMRHGMPASARDELFSDVPCTRF